MPWQPLKRCSYPNCRERVKSGRCEQHKREARRQQDSKRGSRRERGYTPAWDKYRLQFLKSNPLCVHCFKVGVYAPATIVDHIIPIDGGSDVLFWPDFNHQPLCNSCHSRKTVTTDPTTKQRRKNGEYRELEAKAAQRNNWIHEYNQDA
ncbi:MULTISPECIES: HNH endonuclease [Xenorhabdus]|uniref:Putative HNH nuclease YajD n=1 Tax=Xenorhabdus ishibashii TaxID=1034471 RepID=A0A2D0K992_9GAMM|nr:MULTISPECIES: HNH endonuclease [Xenorhabdus]PHM39240.1 HNH endonuclease [Xenorhabdus szentirmaii]PHM59154.1 HNH endonuclease [Xenorhabdus ishibashii]PHM60024.1 HNH endonuclease [Xenorhabdus ishibashii]PHM60050.1 HNH endonuclease [Xenorhabdus ishibashii]PHM60068.1 HNH endonuclease [Xenorhabdus ishibashii]